MEYRCHYWKNGINIVGYECQRMFALPALVDPLPSWDQCPYVVLGLQQVASHGRALGSGTSGIRDEDISRLHE